jgi:hypothetical protein
MKTLGYTKRRKAEKAEFYKKAQVEVISATRQNVESNLEKAELPTQRVYIVSSETMYDIVSGEGEHESQIIDEAKLLRDILNLAEEKIRKIDSPSTEPTKCPSIEQRKIDATSAALDTLDTLGLEIPASSSG